MKQNTIITIIFILVVVAGLFIMGYLTKGGTTASVQNVTGQSTSSLTISRVMHDFGVISMKNGVVNTDFIVSNPTADNITIKSIETSCMCTSVAIVMPDGSLKGNFGMAGHGGSTLANEIIKSGESLTLRTTFDPKAHGPAGVGKIDRFIKVVDNTGISEFQVKANVTP